MSTKTIPNLLTPATRAGLIKRLAFPENYKLVNYTPHDHQLPFHSSIRKIRAIFGGNRSGKTVAGIAEVCMHSTGRYPPWYPENMRITSPNIGRIIATDFAKGIGENIEPMLKVFLPPDTIKSTHKSPQGVTTKYIVKHISGGESRFDVMSCEQDTRMFEGWKGHWVYVDEPLPHDKWIATLRGLVDYAGRMWMSMTLLEEPWIYDDIWGKGTNSTDNKPGSDKDIEYWVIDTRDNPYLPEEEIKSFESKLTPEERETRIHGRPRYLAGLIYKGLKPVHWITPHRLPIVSQRTIYMSCDPHDRQDTALSWAYTNPVHDVIFFMEEKISGAKEPITIKQICITIKEMETAAGFARQTHRRLIDPNFGAKMNVTTGRTIVEEFAYQSRLPENYRGIGDGKIYPIDFELANDNIAAGHLKVNEYLHFDPTKPVGLTNCPKVFFFDTLRHHRYGLEHYIWDEYRTEGKDKKEKPKDFAKHFPDCVRYLLMENPRHIRREDQRSPEAPVY